MSRPPTLSAALSRLERYSRTHDEIDGSKQLAADLERALRALRTIECAAEHTDDRDMEPVFEVRPACLWKGASKGLLHCIERAMQNEDLPDGGTMR